MGLILIYIVNVPVVHILTEKMEEKSFRVW